MSKRRSYKASLVNQLSPDAIVTDAMSMALRVIHVGIDVSKHDLFVVFRFGARRFSRPIKVLQPSEIGLLIARLASIHERVPIQVGLESTGTYGDAIRFALHAAGFDVFRISGKLVADYEEIFDGVPSKHDGKDAAMIAELLAFEKATLSVPLALPVLSTHRCSICVPEPSNQCGSGRIIGGRSGSCTPSIWNRALDHLKFVAVRHSCRLTGLLWT